MYYDVVVIGAGHAGIEACLASSRMNKKTAIVTLSKDMIGSMPCNPSVGGPAKGIVVREIDALGGMMPIAADKTALQFKMLNTTKGPGVWSLRVQSDKIAYKRFMKKALEEQENLDIIEAACKSVVIKDKKAAVICAEPQYIDLAIGIDMATAYLEQKDLNHSFRIMETVLPRIKEPNAIVVLE